MRASVLLSSTCVAICMALMGQPANAQSTTAQSAKQAYPDRPIVIVVPYRPGGGVDTMSRVVGERLQKRLGQTVIIENRAGASTNIGMAHVIRAKPDGYTLFMATTPTVVNPSIQENMQYDPRDGLVPISLIATYPTLLIVHPSLPVKSVKELIEYAKANPSTMNYASVGAGSSTHLAAEMFKYMAGVDITHVPYNGSAPATFDLISGRVQMMFSTMLTGLPYAQEGKARALAVTTPYRSPAAPDLPTVAESGLEGFDVTSFYGLMAPKGTPEYIIKILNEAVTAEMKDPALEERFKDEGLRILAGTPEEYEKFLSEQYSLWPKVIKAAGITLN